MSAGEYQQSPLAIVGLACKFPGANDADEFWQLLLQGRHGISELPPDRLDQRLYYDERRQTPEKSYSRIAGTVPLLPVDRNVAAVSDETVRTTDPTHLTMFEVACAAVDSAGCLSGRRALAARSAGVFLGNCTGSNLEADLVYHSHAEELADLLREIGSGHSLSPSVLKAAGEELAARIRHRVSSWKDCPVKAVTPIAAAHLIQRGLGLSGPAVALDAACASSFYAIHLAAMALHSGRIEAAIVGAFSYRNWWEMVLLSPTQTMSATHSSPFTADADGMVPSDGYAAIVMKTLSRAVGDGDQILGVIRGLGVSSDGRGRTVWAPRQEGQVAAIRRAYEHGVDPRSLQYLEAHATSTQLGDSTEIASLSEALGAYITPGTPIGSVKVNIGHTLEVAGMAGLIKTLLAMKHGVIPPAVHGRTLNPQIDWANLPFCVPEVPVVWKRPASGAPRRAAVDAFGIGGLNVHLVVDEGPAEGEVPSSDRSRRVADSTITATFRQEIAVVGASCPVNHTSLVSEFIKFGNLSSAETLCISVKSSDAAAEYVFDWRKHKIPPRQVATSNPLQFLLLDAAVEALKAGNYGDRDFERSRVATVVGTHFTSDFSCDALIGARLPEIRETIVSILETHGVPDDRITGLMADYSRVLKERKPASQDVSGSMASSTLSSMVAKHLDLMGGAVTVEGGSRTAHAALVTASDLLRSRTCDMVVCAVGQRMNDVSFARMIEAGKGPADCSPGTGAAAFVLKRVADAERDGDVIFGVLSLEEMSEEIPVHSDAVIADVSVSDVSVSDAPRAASSSSQSSVPVKHGKGVMHTADQISAVLLEAVAELSGLPVSIISLSADLSGDLGLSEAARLLLIDALNDAFPDLSEVLCRIPVFSNLEQLVSLVLSPETPVPGVPGKYQPSGDVELTEKSRPIQTAAELAPVSQCGVYRLVESQLSSAPGADPVFSGTALIIGDNPQAVALAERLQRQQVETKRLVFRESVDDLLQQMESVLKAEVIPHLFLMSACDPVAEPGAASMALWGQSVQNHAAAAVLACHRWYQHILDAGRLQQASLAAVTVLGADLDISGGVDAAGAGISSLLKSLAKETDGRLRVCSIAVPRNEPAGMVASAICRELAITTGDTETASIRGKRFVSRPTLRWIREGRSVTAGKGSVWVIAGDVNKDLYTAVRAMGVRFELRLHMIGRIQNPDSKSGLQELSGLQEMTDDGRRQLQHRIMRAARNEGLSPLHEWNCVKELLELKSILVQLRRDGVSVEYHYCPAGDPSAMEVVLRGIRETDGPIGGVIVGPSLSPPCQFRKLQQQTLNEALGSSVAQAVTLMELTTGDPLSHFIGITSASGRHGAGLRATESVCNELLTRTLKRFAAQRGPSCRVFSLLPSLGAVEQLSGGRKHQGEAEGLCCELSESAAAVQTLADFDFGVSDDREFLVAAEKSGNRDSRFSSVAEEAISVLKEDSAHMAAESPLIEHAFFGMNGELIAEIHFDPAMDPFLNGHLHEGIPLLPAVCGIESCVEAAFVFSGGRRINRIVNLQIQNGFRMALPRLYRSRVVVTGLDSGMNCQLQGEFCDRHGVLVDPFRVYQTCIVQTTYDVPPICAPGDWHLPDEWTEVVYADSLKGIKTIGAGGTVYYGPELRTLRYVSHDQEGSWGRMTAPSTGALGGGRQGSLWHTPAALLDGALFLCDLNAKHSIGTQQLPHVIDQIDLGSLPEAGEECLVRVIYRGQDGRRLTWDIWIMRSDGAVVLRVYGFHVVTL